MSKTPIKTENITSSLNDEIIDEIHHTLTNTNDTEVNTNVKEPEKDYDKTTIAVRNNCSWNPFNWLYSNDTIEEIESKMFKSVKIPINRFYVKIRNESLKIWTITTNTESTNLPIVLVHGFCGGIGLWVHNIEALSATRPFYAFDLLGFGRSSRPPFSSDPIVAETQFVESIEDWRKEIGLKEFILLGHSFGGYLTSSYALRYPEHVKAIILADPWGFPEYVDEEKPDTPVPLWISVIARASQYVSPLTIFRLTGQVGVSLFKHLRPDFKKKYMSILDDPELVYSYLYHANNSNPSGEAGFRAVAKFFGYAKNPMIKRIENVKTHIPIWFVYGSRSWIDCTAGYSAVYIRQKLSQTAQISVEIISGAGHHVYADKPTEFNDYIRYLLEEVGINEELVQDSESGRSSPSFQS